MDPETDNKWIKLDRRIDQNYRIYIPKSESKMDPKITTNRTKGKCNGIQMEFDELWIEIENGHKILIYFITCCVSSLFYRYISILQAHRK